MDFSSIPERIIDMNQSRPPLIPSLPRPQVYSDRARTDTGDHFDKHSRAVSPDKSPQPAWVAPPFYETANLARHIEAEIAAPGPVRPLDQAGQKQTTIAPKRIAHDARRMSHHQRDGRMPIHADVIDKQITHHSNPDGQYLCARQRARPPGALSVFRGGGMR